MESVKMAIASASGEEGASSFLRDRSDRSRTFLTLYERGLMNLLELGVRVEGLNVEEIVLI